jgi:hypothetical protein
MKLAVIKSILKENKEALKGKNLQVGYETYNSLKEFGTAILEASKKENNGLQMVLTLNNIERCLSVENAIRYAFKNERFDTVKIFQIPVRKQVNLDYSNVDFKAFGTTA